MANQLGTQLDTTLKNTSIQYTFDVFEDADVSRSINSYLAQKYGANQIAAQRADMFDGRTIVRSTSSDVNTVDSQIGDFNGVNHGVSIDWTGKVAKGNEERIVPTLEQLLQYQQQTNPSLNTIFLESDSVVGLQQNLNKLGRGSAFRAQLTADKARCHDCL